MNQEYYNYMIITATAAMERLHCSKLGLWRSMTHDFGARFVRPPGDSWVLWVVSTGRRTSPGVTEVRTTARPVVPRPLTVAT